MALQDIINAVNAAETDKQALTAAQTALASSQATLSAAQKADAAITTAQTDVAAKTQAVADAETKLHNDHGMNRSADVQTLNAAKAALATSQAAFNNACNANTAVVAAQADIATKTKAVSDAVTRLSSDRDGIEQLLNAEFGARHGFGK